MSIGNLCDLPCSLYEVSLSVPWKEKCMNKQTHMKVAKKHLIKNVVVKKLVLQKLCTAKLSLGNYAVRQVLTK